MVLGCGAWLLRVSLNGVMRGGQISWTYTSYMRSGFRRGGRVANSDSSYDIGFLWMVYAEVGIIV